MRCWNSTDIKLRIGVTFEAISQQKSTCSTALCSNCCTKDSQPSLHGRFVEQVVSHTQKAHQDHRPHPSNQQHMAREEKNKPDKKPQLLPLHYSRANSQPVPGGSPWAAPCQEKRMADERREKSLWRRHPEWLPSSLPLEGPTLHWRSDSGKPHECTSYSICSNRRREWGDARRSP